MYRKLTFFGYLLFTIITILSLNLKINDIPPIGKFLNPYSGFWVNGENKVGDNLNKIMQDFKKYQNQNYDWFQNFLLKLLK